jgi:hypothetical protein
VEPQRPRAGRVEGFGRESLDQPEQLFDPPQLGPDEGAGEEALGELADVLP